MQSSTDVRNASLQRRPEPTTQHKVPTYFYTECSVCGRQLRVFVEHLGQVVACSHCGGSFLATDPASNIHRPCSVLEKANQLLARCSESRDSQ